MTNQEIFNTVALHLLNQGARSIEASSGNCRYRGSEGRMCAAGVLIKDEFYSPKLENKTVYDLGVQKALNASGVEFEWGDNTYFLIKELQELHDSADPADWRARLIYLAKRDGLDYSVLGEG